MKKLFSVLLFMSFATTYCPRQTGGFIENCLTMEISASDNEKSLEDAIRYAQAKLKNLKLKTLSKEEKEDINKAIKSGGRYSIYRERKNDQLPLELLFGNKKYLHGEDE